MTGCGLEVATEAAIGMSGAAGIGGDGGTTGAVGWQHGRRLALDGFVFCGGRRVRCPFAASAVASAAGMSHVDSDPAKVSVRIADDPTASAGERRRQDNDQSAVQHERQHPAGKDGQTALDRRRARLFETRWRARIRHDRLDGACHWTTCPPVLSGRG